MLSGGLGERLLFMRPFIPDKGERCRRTGKLSYVVASGKKSQRIGRQNMRGGRRCLHLSAGLGAEVVRTRRMSWLVAGYGAGAAAAVGNRCPTVHDGDADPRRPPPSRRAAMAAIEDAEPIFVTPAGFA